MLQYSFPLCDTGCGFFSLFSKSHVVYPVHLAATWSHGMSMHEPCTPLSVDAQLWIWGKRWPLRSAVVALEVRRGQKRAILQRADTFGHGTFSERQLILIFSNCFIDLHIWTFLDYIFWKMWDDVSICQNLVTTRVVLVHDFLEVRINTFLSGGSLLWQWCWIWFVSGVRTFDSTIDRDVAVLNRLPGL